MKIQILFLLFALAITSVVHAGEDPMKSLFVFQQKMVRTGNTTAMMKLGEMYEQGAGTKQNLDKALEMYRRAKAGGNPGAEAAIARVIRLRKAHADAVRRKKEHTSEAKQREQQQKRAEAEHRAQLERQARAREAARKARAKARQQALARQRAEQARRRREAQARASAERAARARAAAAAAARKKARQRAQQNKIPVETRQKPVIVKKKGHAKKAEKFTSDPCKGTAARLMSLCN